MTMLKHAKRQNYDININHTEKTEIGLLADEINAFLKGLSRTTHQMLLENETFSVIINSIVQSIWVVDTRGKIIHANNSFIELVGTEQVVDHFLWEVFRNIYVIDLFNETVATKSIITKEFEYNNHVYVAGTSYFKKGNLIIFTMLDITQIKTLDKLKQDFTLKYISRATYTLNFY